MRRFLLRPALIAALALAAYGVAGLGTSTALAVDNGYPQSNQDLFYNFYAHPGPCGGVPAPMYVSPVPVPPHVGHTWITYQAFMPHHYMFPHKRKYVKYHYENDCATLRKGGKTTTCIRWY